MLDKYTCPLNGYTPPELSFSFMLTSKVKESRFPQILGEYRSLFLVTACTDQRIHLSHTEVCFFSINCCIAFC